MKALILRDKCYILTFFVVFITFLFKLLYVFVWPDLLYVKLFDIVLSLMSIIVFTDYLINRDFKIIYSLLLIGYSVGYIFVLISLNLYNFIDEYITKAIFYFIVAVLVVSLFLSIRSIYLYAINLSKKKSMLVKEYNSESSLILLFMLSVVAYMNLL